MARETVTFTLPRPWLHAGLVGCLITLSNGETGIIRRIEGTSVVCELTRWTMFKRAARRFLSAAAKLLKSLM